MTDRANGSSERRARSNKETLWSRVAWFSLALTTIGAPLLFGGAPGWTVPIIAACAGLTALLTAYANHRAGKVLAPSAVLAMLIGAALFTVLQALPLPCELVAVLSPDAVRHARASAALFGQDALCTISEDPGVTQEEVLKALAWLAVYASTAWTMHLVGRKNVAKTLALGTGALGFVALVHVTLNAERVYGILLPSFGSAQYAPFVNPNHLGGLTAMGVPLAIGIARAETPQSGRSMWIALVIFLLASTSITLSRGAILAALVGAALSALLLFRASRRTSAAGGWKEASLLVLGLVVAAGAVLGAAGTEALQGEFANTDISKLDITARALELAVVGPWLGVGRGAFGSVFVERAGVSTIRYEFVENFIGQWCVDWGIVFGSIGSDTGGSIRLPASMNGLFGMKPTYGRVSRAGCFPRAFSLDCAGPLARSAEDCAILLQAIAGRDDLDPSSLDLPVPDYVAALQSAHVGSRIAANGWSAYRHCCEKSASCSGVASSEHLRLRCHRGWRSAVVRSARPWHSPRCVDGVTLRR